MAEDENYVEKVREDHYLHRLCLIGVSFWGAQIWGWLWGLLLFVGIISAISVGNIAILATTGNLKIIRVNRWTWIVVGLVLIIATTASIGP